MDNAISMESKSFSDLTTIKLGGKVKALVEYDKKSELISKFQLAKSICKNIQILGAGSNILAKDNEHDLVVFRSNVKIIGPVSEDGDEVIIKVTSGEPLGNLVNYCQRKGYSGIEGLVGIPGQVGGAVAMNAGSYGCEISKVLTKINYFCFETEKFATIEAKDVKFAYRYCSLTENKTKFITSVYIKLKKSTKEAVSELTQSFLKKKKETQPISLASAGCVFKNPENNSAGKLLDELGFKGKKLNNMCFSDMHANFLINIGNGTANDALNLIAEAQQKVREKYNINLELEVRVI